jgi:hypothetical protein
MNKSLYYIECTCIRDCKFPNVEYHIGDIVYFNPKAASNETYVGYGKDKNPYYYWSSTHLPFTRQKKFAKKWQIKEYPERYARMVNDVGQFTAIVKEIKLTYTEEEI